MSGREEISSAVKSKMPKDKKKKKKKSIYNKEIFLPIYKGIYGRENSSPCPQLRAAGFTTKLKALLFSTPFTFPRQQ